ncbi:S8 family peptidase [Thermus thermamylovorans]|uniref:Serine protease n=1 Tax=Thermus thermamylovorans TaxID=2509362 RepID=A0A4Q9B7F8_9DEIN|nr:S8 family serine peptidase [Thermus thermamylovorans]TBH21052.1 serine protease [Thermus thermamylovorans]
MRHLAFAVLLAGLALLLAACPQTPPPPVNPADCPVGPLGAQGAEEPLRLQGLGRFAGEYVPGELLVLPQPGLSLQALRAEGVEPQEALSQGLLRVKVPKGQEEAKARALLRAGAQYVQPNYLYRPLRTPNDPFYATHQRAYLDGLVGLEAAWNQSTGRGCPPLIAVLDTGILDHEDFQTSKYLPAGVNLDVADGDADPTDRSADRGHGLAVASVLGADTQNGRGMAGVTWGGYIVPIKVFPDGGRGTTATLLEGVRLARSLGVRVANISLGANVYDPPLDEELTRARAQGMVIVAAAGNYESPYPGYSSGGPVLFPASSPSTLAVGAVDQDRRRASFSALGPELDLVAPGVGVLVAAPSGGYARSSGTSFASPIVAGVAALYMSRYASERKEWPTPDQVYTCLTQTAEDLGPAGKDDEYGFGLVRADRVLTDTTYCFP